MLLSRSALPRIAAALAALVIGLFANHAFAQLPTTQLTSLYPAGGKVGAPAEVTVAGADLDEAELIVFSHPGITSTPKMGEPLMPGKPAKKVANQFTVTIQGKLTAGNGRAALMSADKAREHNAKLRELYLLAFAREPSPEEAAIAMAHIQKNTEDPKRAYEDIVWALINTKEFLFNH